MKDIRAKIANLEFNTTIGGMLSKTFAPRLTKSTLKSKSHFREVVFVHIPKTAGTSIANHLFRSPLKGHIPISRLFYQDRLRYHESFKFTFARNPWDRFESGFYHYIRAIHGNIKWERAREISELFRGIDSIDNFVSKILTNNQYRKAIFRLPLFRPQCDWITVPSERGQRKNIGVDFIGKYERLNQDITLLKNTLGITIDSELPTLRNRNPGRHKNINNADDYLKLIRNNYSRDLALLNYSI